MTKMDTTNTKIIFIITFAWLIYINSVYCSYAESVNILRTPLNTIEPQRWHSASDEIAKNGRKLRTEDHVFSDRARLKELLDKGPHTAKELAELTGRPVYTVRYDIRYTPELRNHRNLIERERRLEEKIASDRRARFKELLEQGPHTAKELAELTGRPLSTVWSDIRYTPELKNHRNLVIRKERPKKEITSDRARLKELLDQGPHTVKELAELTGRPVYTVRYDLAGTPELRNHSNLVLVTRKQREEWIASDRARLKELLEQGPHTVKELAELTGRPVSTVRNDIDGTIELKNHRNLIERERRPKKEITSDRARLKKLLDQGQHTIKELAELTGIPLSTVRYDLAGTPELKNHRNLVRKRERRGEEKDFKKYSLSIDVKERERMQRFACDILDFLFNEYVPYFYLFRDDTDSVPISYIVGPLGIGIENITNQHGQNIEIKLEIIDTPYMFDCKHYTDLVRVFPTGFKDRYSVLIQRCVFEIGEESQTKALSTALVKYGLDVVFALSAGYSLEEAIATAKDIQDDFVESFLEPRLGVSSFEELKLRIEEFYRAFLEGGVIYETLNPRQRFILLSSAFQKQTNTDIAESIGVSKERVGQIRNKIGRILLHPVFVIRLPLLPHFIRHWEARTFQRYYTQEDLIQILIEADNEMVMLFREIELESAKMHRDDI